MIRLRALLPLLAIAIPSLATAQGTGPVSPIVGWELALYQIVVNFVTSHADIFLTKAQQIFLIVIGVGLLWRIGGMILRWFSPGYHAGYLNLLPIIYFIVDCALAGTILRFYASPIPGGGGLTFYQIFPAIARDLTATIDTSAMDNLLGFMVLFVKSLQKPNIFDFLAVIIYALTLLQMALMTLVIFFVDAFGFLGLGYVTLWGPIMVALYPIKWAQPLFWRWFNLLIGYSMYQVTAAMFVYIWSNFMLMFLSQIIGTDYSLGSLIALLPIMLALDVCFAISMFKVPGLNAQLFSGAGNVGQGILGDVRNAIATVAKVAAA